MLRLGLGNLARGRAPVWARLLSAATSGATGTPFILADIGEGISEVEVLRWHVKNGDRVKVFDPLVEVQSDKATVEITSRYEGVVSDVAYDEGEMAAVGRPLCHILTEDAPTLGEIRDSAGADSVPDIGPDMAWNESAASAHEQSELDRPSSKEALAIPAVRRLAKEHGVDIASITGTYVTHPSVTHCFESGLDDT
jgi:2-oxoisovalerate dehydrogenase E2 component (dihydrolipoyl transacylase)